MFTQAGLSRATLEISSEFSSYFPLPFYNLRSSSYFHYIHKSGFIIYYFISSVNIKPPRHRFGLSLCMGLAIKPCPFQISNAHISNTFHSNPYCDIITFILERRQICIGLPCHSG